MEKSLHNFPLKFVQAPFLPTFCIVLLNFDGEGTIKNIARGTTDLEIDSVTWIKLGNNMAPLTLVANLATRWRHLH